MLIVLGLEDRGGKGQQLLPGCRQVQHLLGYTCQVEGAGKVIPGGPELTLQGITHPLLPWGGLLSPDCQFN